MAGNDDSRILEEWKRKRLENLLKRKDKPEFIVLTSPTCPYCLMAVEVLRGLEKEGRIRFREVSVATEEGMRLAIKHNIAGVPSIIYRGRLAFAGVPRREDILKLIGGG